LFKHHCKIDNTQILNYFWMMQSTATHKRNR
jgi:hypothetical protein